MKRFLIFVILLLSLSAVFATEEQVFALLDAIVKNPHEKPEKILFENGFIPVAIPDHTIYDAYAQNYFGDTKIIAKYFLNESSIYIDFTFKPRNDKEFTVTAQKILQYFTSKYEYIYKGFWEANSHYRWDFPQKEYCFIIWYETNGDIEIVKNYY